MFKSIAAAVTAAVALAYKEPTAAERVTYKVFDDEMKKYGRKYEVH